MTVYHPNFLTKEQLDIAEQVLRNPGSFMQYYPEYGILFDPEFVQMREVCLNLILEQKKNRASESCEL